MKNKKLISVANRIRLIALAGLIGLGFAVAGCEVKSFMDPSKLGRFERTPVQLPILDRLDVIEPENAYGSVQISQVQAEDLIPDVQEYVLGVSDTIQISIFELIRPGEDSVLTRRINEVGMIRLPIVG